MIFILLTLHSDIPECNDGCRYTLKVMPKFQKGS